jgi:hypothetical protein
VADAVAPEPFLVDFEIGPEQKLGWHKRMASAARANRRYFMTLRRDFRLLVGNSSAAIL